MTEAVCEAIWTTTYPCIHVYATGRRRQCGLRLSSVCGQVNANVNTWSSALAYNLVSYHFEQYYKYI